MGLFGKKKTPEAVLAEGRAQYEKGDLKKAFLTLHGLAGKGNPQACYYIGRIYLERGESNLTRSFLTTAAKGGVQEAAALLASEFGIRDSLPEQAAAPAAAVSAPVRETDQAPGVDDLLEELEETGALLQETKRELKRAEKKASRTEVRPRPKASAPAERAAPAPPAESDSAGPQKGVVELLQKWAAAYKAGDYPAALAFVERAAERGSADAQFSCGYMYDHGEGTAVNMEKAFYWYEKAAQQGVGNAQFQCGRLYGTGQGTELDMEKAIFWIKKAAGQGVKDAQKFLDRLGARKAVSDLLREGLAAYQAGDYPKALTCFEELARQGNRRAQLNCGILYAKGQGTAKNQAKALFWFEKAARQGDINAQLTCGQMYFDGEGTKADKKKALYWYKKAAEQGDPNAQKMVDLLTSYLEVLSRE